MNIRELANINFKGLQQIDKDEIIQFIKSRPVVFINIGIVLASFLISYFIYSSYKSKAKSLTTKITALEKKVEAKKSKETILNDMHAIATKFPKIIGRDELINQVSAMAFQEEVKIIRITPGISEENDYLKTFKFNIQVTAEDFERLINFVRSMENSPYAIRVQRISSSMQGNKRRRASREDPEAEMIQMEIDIISMELKNAVE